MRALLLLSLLLIRPVNVPAQTNATELDASLNARVPQYTLKAKGLADAILRIAKQFELPVGIEWLKDDEALRGLDLTWRDATVGDIIGSVVNRYPPYSYGVQGGVIHVLRPDLLSDTQNFLNLKVPDFFEVRQKTGGFANVQLRQVVQSIVSPRNLPPGAGEAGSYTSGNVPEKPLTLTLRGLTIREALEKLAEASERKIWVVTFSGGAGLTPTGFRRTETLWHPTPFPDSDQPMWDFLAWREYMPESAPGARPSPH
jgi:hypothetical protein